MKQQLQRERYQLLRSVEELLEGPMIFLGFVWLILLVVELIWKLPLVLDYLGLGIWALFIFDFLLKFFLAPKKLAFVKKNWLTAISLIVPALRVFRAVRVFRLLRGLRGVRLLRVVSSLNRSIKSLGATMQRRGFAYVFALTLVVIFGGAAGMYAIERGHQGFENYGAALWWTTMRIITAGSEHDAASPEGRALQLLLALFGFTIFGYVTATLATYFIGRDAEEEDAPVAGAAAIAELKTEIGTLTQVIRELQGKMEGG